MKQLSLALTLALAASPALAEEEAFFSLRSTEFVVTIAFLVFIGVLLKFKVPSLIGGMLDKRAQGIKADLEAAKALHEEAKVLLQSYEKKHKEVQEQADQIVLWLTSEPAWPTLRSHLLQIAATGTNPVAVLRRGAEIMVVNSLAHLMGSGGLGRLEKTEAGLRYEPLVRLTGLPTEWAVSGEQVFIRFEKDEFASPCQADEGATWVIEPDRTFSFAAGPATACLPVK